MRVARRAPAVAPVSQPEPQNDDLAIVALECFDKAIADAVKKATAEIGKLIKTDKNEYANYAYAPIDAYYERAVPIISKHGLKLDAEEIDCQHLGGDYLLYRYRGVLTFKDGRRFEVGLMSVPHPVTGPQTAGSAQSYADKALMRRFFKIATGEADGDQVKQKESRFKAVDNTAVRPVAPVRSAARTPTKPRVPELAPEKRPTMPEDFVRLVREIDTDDGLNTLWAQCSDFIDNLKDTEPREFRWVRALFRQRKDEIVGGTN